MITKVANNRLSQSQEFTSYSFGIKESGLSHIFNVLRNQLYSDKILAVIREYSANALDAHAEVGKQEVPIEITIPTKLNLNFEVRDFGRGLTEKEIGEIYAMYGESTKRGTNEQIGQLGLGSKSGFAYGDSFLITSWAKGKQTTYKAFIDPSQVGRIAKMDQQDSDQPCGVKITVPVRPQDVESFTEKATKLFQRFSVTPSIKGITPEDFEKNFTKQEVALEGKDKSWRILKEQSGHSRSSFAIMGNIAYPIDIYALDLDYSDKIRDLLTCSSFDLRFNIGDLEVAASREGLQYTDFTKEAILNKLNSIVKELPDLCSELFKNCKTLWETKNVYFNLFRYGGALYGLKDFVSSKKVKWNGKPINDVSFHFNNQYAKEVFGFSLKVFAKPNNSSLVSGYGSRVKHEKTEQITPAPTRNILIVENDMTPSIRPMNRIACLLEDYEGRPSDMEKYDWVYLVSWGDKKDELLKKTGFDAPTVKLSELQAVKMNVVYPVNSSNSNGTSANRSKHQSKEFILDTTSVANGNTPKRYEARSSYFDNDSIDVSSIEDGVYLRLDRFYIDLDKGGQTEPYYVLHFLHNLESMGIKLPKIYGFKPKALHKVRNKNNWTEFSQWAINIVKKHLKDNKHDQDLCDYYHVLKHIEDRGSFDFFSNLPDTKTKKGNKGNGEVDIVKVINDSVAIKKSNPMLEYVNAFQSMNKFGGTLWNQDLEDEPKWLENLSHISTLRNRHWGSLQLNVVDLFDNKPSFDLTELRKKVAGRYPLFTRLSRNEIGNSLRTQIIAEMCDYINMVDMTCVENV